MYTKIRGSVCRTTKNQRVVTYFNISMPTVQLSLTSCIVGLTVGQLTSGH